MNGRKRLSSNHKFGRTTRRSDQTLHTRVRTVFVRTVRGCFLGRPKRARRSPHPVVSLNSIQIDPYIFDRQSQRLLLCYIRHGDPTSRPGTRAPAVPSVEEVPIATPSQTMDRDIEAAPEAAGLPNTTAPAQTRREESEPFMDIDPVPVGRFRDGFCDCFAHGYCHGHCLTAHFCPIRKWVRECADVAVSSGRF
jgi:hypothetical protein